MADIVDKAKRSQMMSGIRGKNTGPELLVRKGLHKQGLRYRLHGHSLPGNPDLVLKKYKAVVFVHGCFWHLHGCKLFKMPQTRTDFWEAKLEGNRLRDERNLTALLESGWRVAVVWECWLRTANTRDNPEAMKRLADWIRSGKGIRYVLAADT